MQNIWQHIYAAFIEADRWKLYLKGLGVTLEVSFFAALRQYYRQPRPTFRLEP
jgi:hypothetical protein